MAPLSEVCDCTANDTQCLLQPGLPEKWEEVTPAGWNIETVHLIERLTLNQEIPVINSVILMEDFKNGIKKWKEKTATSPSGCHLGHLHSLLAPDGVQETDEEESTKPLAEKILEVHLSMINLAVDWGYPPLRWRNVVMFVIKKDAGKPKLHRLRNIHLYEADCNFVLKLLWAKHLMQHAECYRMINDAQ